MKRVVVLLVVPWMLACAGLEKVEDKVRDAIAEQAEKAIARSMGVSRSQVEVRAVGDRFEIETPTWDGDCALGPDARHPAGFPFREAGTKVADCTVAPDCKELFGFQCGKGGVDIGLVLSAHGRGQEQSRESSRRSELEGRGWRVERTVKDGSALLTAFGGKGRVPKAVAVVATGDDGGVVELLIAPLK
jgi:hypothetical protein